MPATLFVTTDPEAWVFSLGSNAQRRVTAEEMRELEEGGVTIGSHSVTHGALESMSREEITHELEDSKRHLEEVLGKEVRYFGVPLNWYGPRVRAVAETVGYRAVCTSDNGTIHGGTDPFHMRRFIMEGSFSLEEFARNLRPGAIVQRRIINFVKRVPARLLGPRIWLPLRRRLFASFLGRYFTLRYFKRLVLAGAIVLVLALFLVVWLLAGS
jgi:peptidoglycan/xylan/chitin deacetylase (PgdA/CDA1 family)